jgi:hypothetical protein
MTGSFIKVAGKNTFDYGFSHGVEKDQLTLRQSAVDVIMISLSGWEKQMVLGQFQNLPFNTKHGGALVYYGDMAKFVARHLVLCQHSQNEE